MCKTFIQQVKFAVRVCVKVGGIVLHIVVGKSDLCTTYNGCVEYGY